MTNEERERRDGISVGEAWRGRRFTIGEALGRALESVVSDLAAGTLIERARAGGEPAAAAMRELIETSQRAVRTMRERVERAERLAAQAAVDNGPKGRATLMAQAALLPVPNPPKGHRWSTIPDAPEGASFEIERAGTLYCGTCSANGQNPPRIVSASECLIMAVGT